MGVPALWIANKDFSPALVQKMTAAVYGPEGHAHMMKVHAGSKDMVPRDGVEGDHHPAAQGGRGVLEVHEGKHPRDHSRAVS